MTYEQFKQMELDHGKGWVRRKLPRAFAALARQCRDQLAREGYDIDG